MIIEQYHPPKKTIQDTDRMIDSMVKDRMARKNQETVKALDYIRKSLERFRVRHHRTIEIEEMDLSLRDSINDLIKLIAQLEKEV